jgi:hypothetical protein
MQIPLANMDSSVLEEVSIPLWTALFEAVGWPASLRSKQAAGFTHDDLLEAFRRDELGDELLLALETLHTLGTATGRDAINAIMSDRHVPLDALPHGLGERELALRLFLKQREDAALAEVFSRVQILVQEGDHRRFNDFIGKTAKRVSGPEAKRGILEDAIREHCRARDLGEHVQLRVFGDEDGTCCFQIMRSHHVRKPLAVLPGASGRATIEYRPVHTDLIRYEASLGRLRITARAASIVDFYRRVFGRVLFDDEGFFDGDAVCSLAVLQEKGRQALNHRVHGVGCVWMTQCLWERGDGEKVTIQAADCFDTIESLHLDLAEGTMLQAKLKMEVTGKSTRPVTVNVRAPSRIEISRGQHELLVNEVLDAIGIRGARKREAENDLWSLFPWRHPLETWRALFQGDISALASAGVLKKTPLHAIADPAQPGAGRVLHAERVSGGEFVGVSQMAEIPPRSLSATDLDGLALDVEAFQAHARSLLGLDGVVQRPGDDGLLDLGVLSLGDMSFRLTYAMRQPPQNAAAIVNVRAAGERTVILLPMGADEVPGIPSVPLDHPLPAKNALLRQIVATLNLADQVPALLTAPDRAQLVVDTVRGKVWLHGIAIDALTIGSHQFKFTELMAKHAPKAVPKADLVDALSATRADGDQTARTAKSKTIKAMKAAVEAAGKEFHDPFQAANGSYRLTLCAHVV